VHKAVTGVELQRCLPEDFGKLQVEAFKKMCSA